MQGALWYSRLWWWWNHRSLGIDFQLKVSSRQGVEEFCDGILKATTRSTGILELGRGLTAKRVLKVLKVFDYIYLIIYIWLSLIIFWSYLIWGLVKQCSDTLQNTREAIAWGPDSKWLQALLTEAILNMSEMKACVESRSVRPLRKEERRESGPLPPQHTPTER